MRRPLFTHRPDLWIQEDLSNFPVDSKAYRTPRWNESSLRTTVGGSNGAKLVWLRLCLRPGDTGGSGGDEQFLTAHAGRKIK